MASRAMKRTSNGYLMQELTSAVQKCIRRGLEFEAVFFACEMADAGSGEYLWRRLCVIASEDIGLADPHAITLVTACAESWATGARHLPIAHAVLHLCRAPKSREIDDILNLRKMVAEGKLPGHEKPEIPDFALDMHTDRGKEMGRGMRHWYIESSRVWPPAVKETPDQVIGTEAVGPHAQRPVFGTKRELPRWTAAHMTARGFDPQVMFDVYRKAPDNMGFGGDYCEAIQTGMFEGDDDAPDLGSDSPEGGDVGPPDLS